MKAPTAAGGRQVGLELVDPMPFAVLAARHRKTDVDIHLICRRVVQGPAFALARRSQRARPGNKIMHYDAIQEVNANDQRVRDQVCGQSMSVRTRSGFSATLVGTCCRRLNRRGK